MSLLQRSPHPKTRPEEILMTVNLRRFLDPGKSPLRTMIALLAVKYETLTRAGRILGYPSIRWFHKELSRSGLSDNYWGIRRQLNRLAGIGVFRVERHVRLVPAATDNDRITRALCCEYYLADEAYPHVISALQELLGVESLRPLFKPHVLKEQFRPASRSSCSPAGPDPRV